jgi:hypothetical protein
LSAFFLERNGLEISRFCSFFVAVFSQKVAVKSNKKLAGFFWLIEPKPRRDKPTL